jgi:hypothetical protein
MEIGSKRAELGIRDMVGWQNGRNAILMGTGKRMVPNTGPEEEIHGRRKGAAAKTDTYTWTAFFRNERQNWKVLVGQYLRYLAQSWTVEKEKTTIW